MENAYDHHTAIYYLLVDRLRQHRSSYPLQTQLETRLRRPSGIAEAAMIGGTREVVVVPDREAAARAVTLRPSRPYLPLQHAINELHNRIPTPPEIRKELAHECMREMSPVRHLGLKARSISPRQMLAQSLSVDSGVQRETENMCQKDSEQNEKMQLDNDIDDDKHKVRRHTLHDPPKKGLDVPSHHPLCSSVNEQIGGVHRISQYVQPKIVVSHCGPSTGSHQPLNSLFSGLRVNEARPPFPSEGHRFHLGRRASDGNAVIPAFHQHLREINRIRQLQQEHQKLQEQYQKSLSPAELVEQQQIHTEYKEKYDEMRQELQREYDKLMAVNAIQRGECLNQSVEQGVILEQQQALHPSPLLKQFQQLHIDPCNRHNPIRRLGPCVRNPHKPVFRTSSYKRAQMSGLLPPLENDLMESDLSCSAENEQQELSHRQIQNDFQIEEMQPSLEKANDQKIGGYSIISL